MRFTVMVRAVLFCSENCRIILDWSWVSDSRLVLDGIEDLVDGEPERSEVFCRLESLEQTR